MKISNVACRLLSCPLPEPLHLPFPGGERIVFKRDAMIVRVTSSDGVAGYAPGPPYEWARDSVARVAAPFLEGRSLGDPDALRVHFQELPGLDPAALHVYGAVEIALYDLLGKSRRAPASEFLGGRVRDRVRVYSSSPLAAAPEAFAESAFESLNAGIRAFKVHAGSGAQRDAQAAELVRRTIGPNCDLIFNAEAWWRTPPAFYPPAALHDLLAELNLHGVAWLEDPLPPENHDAWRDWRDRDSIALAGGALEPDDLHMLDLIFGEAVDFLQIDLARQGGYWAARRLLPETAHAGLRFCFQNCDMPLATAAAAQIALCWPDMVAEWIEVPATRSCFEIGQPPEIRDGNLLAPSGPGLGVEVDERAFDRYPWIAGPASTYRLENSGGSPQ